MAQNTHVIHAPIVYTRADYTALRAYCLKIPLQSIANLYYSEDCPQILQGLESFLIAMRSNLIERAIEHNPGFAHSLQRARQGGALTSKALEILVRAADIPPASPSPEHPISMWFRPRIAASFKQEELKTLGDLTTLINRRGPGWWRCIPRIGEKRAVVIVRWIGKHNAVLGPISMVTSTVTSPAPSLFLNPNLPDKLAPLGRFTASATLDGSEGINRHSQFCFIQARNDLQAIEFYLSRFEDQAHTYRAYRKELERFLIWSIMIAKKPMSSLLVDDCESYKRFLLSPTPEFIGIKAPRFSERWKPFTPEKMSPKSQKHAVIIIRAAFQYLVGVRYLAGNPWIAVKDPSVTQEISLMQIEKALPDDLWKTVIDHLSVECQSKENSQQRIALAAILLLGDSGLRREEAANANRDDLKMSQWSSTVQELCVLGKRNKRRIVPVSARTIEALQAHWIDRGILFNDSTCKYSLIAPLIIPPHSAARKRHIDSNSNGYTANGLYRLICTTLKSFSKGKSLSLIFSDLELELLLNTTPHAFRHTFGTLAVAGGMPLDVAQSVLGHASVGTTGIYVQSKKKRMIEESTKYFGGTETK
jgi:site-specific recombinase XerD